MQDFVLSMKRVLEPIIQSWKTKNVGVKLGSSWVSLLAFADDIMIVSKSLTEASKMIWEIKTALNQIGLDFDECVNDRGCTKNQILQFRAQDEEEHESKIIYLNGFPLEVVDEMLVLGQWISADCSTHRHIENQQNQAQRAFYSNKDMLMCKAVPLKTRVSLLFSLVGSVLLYGSESLPMNSSILRRYQVIINGFILRMLKLAPKENENASEYCHRRNKLLHNIIQDPGFDMVEKVGRKTWNFHGHIFRSNLKCLQNILMWRDNVWWHAQPRGAFAHRKSGQQPKMAIDEINDFLKLHGLQDVANLSRCSERWKAMGGEFAQFLRRSSACQ